MEEGGGLTCTHPRQQTNKNNPQRHAEGGKTVSGMKGGGGGGGGLRLRWCTFAGDISGDVPHNE